jgi:hypothetical protein
MLFIITAQAQLGLQGNCIGKTTLHTLGNGVTGWINKIIEELKYEDVAGIADGKILLEHPEETFVVSLIRVVSNWKNSLNDWI